MTNLSNEIIAACAASNVNLNPTTTVCPTASGLLSDLMTARDSWNVNVPDREWIVDGLIPVGVLTLLTAPGGEGKTLLAQQLATCVSSGTAALGLPVTQTPVIGLYAEDDTNELTRRQQAILRVTCIDPDDAADYHFKSMVGDDTALGRFDRGGTFTPSTLLEELRATALALKSRFIILDNVTQMYAGDFNDRTAVSAFLRPLANLAAEINGAVLLLGHVAKSEDSTFAGSAAWRDNVRSLLTIKRGVHTEGTARLPLRALERDYRTVTQHKANYSAGGVAHVFRWHEGAFVTSQSEDEIADDSSREAIFLRHLATLTSRKMAVSVSRKAQNYAPRVMAVECRASRAHMEDAMERLLEDGCIESDAELPWQRARGKGARGIAEIKTLAPISRSTSLGDIMATIGGRAAS